VLRSEYDSSSNEIRGLKAAATRILSKEQPAETGFPPWPTRAVGSGRLEFILSTFAPLSVNFVEGRE